MTEGESGDDSSGRGHDKEVDDDWERGRQRGGGREGEESWEEEKERGVSKEDFCVKLICPR